MILSMILCIQAVRDIDDIEYDTLVRTSDDDSVLETFDRLQVSACLAVSLSRCFKLCANSLT